MAHADRPITYRLVYLVLLHLSDERIADLKHPVHEMYRTQNCTSTWLIENTFESGWTFVNCHPFSYYLCFFKNSKVFDSFIHVQSDVPQ